MNIHFCTFGDEPRFTNTLAALLEEAKTSGYFDTVRKFNQHDLPVDHNLRAYWAMSSSMQMRDAE